MPSLAESSHNIMAKSGAAGKRKRTESGDGTDAPMKTQRTSIQNNTSSAAPAVDAFNTTHAERDAWLAEDNDSNELVGSSQDDGDGTENLHHYGDLTTKIVGVQYYRGYANPGEQILLKREPGNPYDGNAIRIDNVANTQIGHLPRTQAAKIAKYIDNRWLHFEGQLNGMINTFDCPLLIHIYGPDPNSEDGLRVKEKMIADRLPLKALQDAERRRKQEEKQRLAAAQKAAAAAKVKGKGKYSNQASSVGDGQLEMSDILEASQLINPREISQTADKLGFSEEELENMPFAEKPAAIRTQMLPYQLQALQWLLNQESPEEPGAKPEESVQLWTKTGKRYTNLATNYSTQEAVKLASGGILADDMGLGKTLEMISLIVADIEKSGRGTTLIVAPLSVMSNWSGQIATHVEANHLKVHIHHGVGRGRTEMSSSDFEKHDIVITTYQTLAMDYMPSGKNSKLPERKIRPHGLYSVFWRRVILDEGHIVRNHKSKSANAVTALMAKSRWALTGTPIVNNIRDLFSVLRFIGITGGLQQLDIFNRVLSRPLMNSEESAQILLQLVMKAFTLRRRKDMPFINLKLPKLDEYVQHIEFTAKEQERYDALSAEAKGVLQRVQKTTGKDGERAYFHLLEILLRMRQVCNHWQLCSERVTSLLAQLEDHKVVELTPENKKALQDILRVTVDNQEDCPVCLETLHNPVITTCGHCFGQDCISRVIELQHKCPFCRAPLEDESVLVAPAAEDADENAGDEIETEQSSSKLKHLMQILEAIRGDKRKGDKTVIFSQWTKFLEIIEPQLVKAGYKFCRLDGTMTTKKRDEALLALEKDDECTILLASLAVCAVGLNLTAANNVILADTWWAPAIEDQAVDRVHRLGQTKETRVFRLVMAGSIELGTLDIQQKKRQLMKLAFSEKKSKRDHARSGRLEDIKTLLGKGE